MKMTKLVLVILGSLAIASCGGGGGETAAPNYLDTTFGTGGKVTTDIEPGSADDAYSVAIQADDKIVVAGRSYSANNYDFALTRYNANGSLDTSFSNDGKVTTAIGVVGSNEEARAIAIQADGFIVAAGYALNGTNDDFALTRYDDKGELDNFFGIGGIVRTNIGIASDDYAYSVTIQADKKIVVAGVSSDGGDNDFALTRYSDKGELDNFFGIGGIVRTNIGIGRDDFATSVAIQAGGKIVVAGYSFNGLDNDFVLTRYHAIDGSPDDTFDGGGIVITDILTGSDDKANSIAIQSDGKILVAGSSNDNFALIRYNVNGSLDSNFGTGGMVISDVGGGVDVANSVAIQAGGMIVVAGSSSNGTSNDFALIRYKPNGSLDSTFGANGKVITAIGAGDDVANSVAIQTGNMVVAAGSSNNGTNNDFALVRYLP